jgi:hypothetical protein
VIDEYVEALDRSLSGPSRIKRDVVREARHSLEDAAEAYVDGGLDPRAAGVQAVADFGALAELVPAYQAELAALSVRSLARRIAAVAAVLVAGADLMWQGAPWTGPAPPGGYRTLTASLDGLWLLCGAGAVSALAFLSWRARTGRTVSMRAARTVTAALAAPLALAVTGGVTVYGWSVAIWDAAVTWPPMLAGLLAVAAGYVWLGGALRACLLTSVRPARVAAVDRRRQAGAGDG